MASVCIRFLAGLAGLGAVAVISACGDATEYDSHTSSTMSASITDEGSPHNANDVAFAENMVPHHQQAIDLAGLVSGRSTNPAVIKLASGISAQLEPEVIALRAMSVQWQVNPANDPQHGLQPGGSPGMVDAATVARLKSLTGAEFDTLWLQSMLANHQGAIAMAKAEIAQGQSPDMIAVAKNIVVVQQEEVSQIKQIGGG